MPSKYNIEILTKKYIAILIKERDWVLLKRKKVKNVY